MRVPYESLGETGGMHYSCCNSTSLCGLLLLRDNYDGGWQRSCGGDQARVGPEAQRGWEQAGEQDVVPSHSS